MSQVDTAALLNEAEWRRCAGSGPTDLDACVYFLENHWRIKHPEQGAIPFELRDAQRETLAIWISDRQSITLKARQIGFSTLVIALSFWLCLFHDDKDIIALSKKEDDAAKLLSMGLYGFDRLPQWMRDRAPSVTARTQTRIEFSNGSNIKSLPANDPARGHTAYLIIVDEWAFFPDPEAAWAAIEPATDIGGRVICLSTANGVGNLYHTMVVGSMTGSNGFKFIFYSWRAVPERDDDWYEVKKRSMPEHILHQEYPTTPEEAFIKSGSPVFDVEALDRLPTRPPIRRGFLARTPGLQLMHAEDGDLQVWELPQRKHRYVIGADVAEGLEHGDFSVAHVINHSTGLVAAKWRGHIPPDVFGGRVLFDLGRWFGNAFIGVESNNHGYSTLVALRNAGYRNLYRRTSYDEYTNRRQEKLGWRTQVNTKPLMVDWLSEALRDEEITLLDAETIGELRTFRRVFSKDGHKVSMEGQPYDDQTMSLGIAVAMRQHVGQAKWVDVAEHDPWSLDAAVASLEDTSREVLRVGAGNFRT
jgi:hypothetical protein